MQLIIQALTILYVIVLVQMCRYHLPYLSYLLSDSKNNRFAAVMQFAWTCFAWPLFLPVFKSNFWNILSYGKSWHMRDIEKRRKIAGGRYGHMNMHTFVTQVKSKHWGLHNHGEFTTLYFTVAWHPEIRGYLFSFHFDKEPTMEEVHKDFDAIFFSKRPMSLDQMVTYFSYKHLELPRSMVVALEADSYAHVDSLTVQTH